MLIAHIRIIGLTEVKICRTSRYVIAEKFKECTLKLNFSTCLCQNEHVILLVLLNMDEVILIKLTETTFFDVLSKVA